MSVNRTYLNFQDEHLFNHEFSSQLFYSRPISQGMKCKKLVSVNAWSWSEELGKILGI